MLSRFSDRHIEWCTDIAQAKASSLYRGAKYTK